MGGLKKHGTFFTQNPCHSFFLGGKLIDPMGAENGFQFLRNDVENIWKKAVKVKGN